RELSEQVFREDLKKSVEKFSRRKPLNEGVWQEFSEHSYYVSAGFDDPAGYEALKQRLEQIDAQAGTQCNWVFYLAPAPSYFATIARQLKSAGLLEVSRGQSRATSRVIVEKPFGRDLQSARELNSALLECMKEEQIFRIDHYLGKETVQNLLV